MDLDLLGTFFVPVGFAADLTPPAAFPLAGPDAFFLPDFFGAILLLFQRWLT